jgi:uncharacterized protein (TIGR03083 family)
MAERARLGGMHSDRLRTCLDADYRRLREVAGAADLDAGVPSCPGWTMTDLVRHVGEVYLYKVECMRLGRHSEVWPPEGMNDEPPLQLLDRGYAALADAFDARRPDDYTFTWYEPDQTVGFWIRDMAQETVIHRVDAELGAGASIDAIPDDLAADGIDELLVAFVQYDTALRPERFAELFASANGRTVKVITPQQSWLLSLTSKGLRVDESDVDSPSATVEGPAPGVLLWLWNRSQTPPATVGDDEAIALLRQVLVGVLDNRQQD